MTYLLFIYIHTHISWIFMFLNTLLVFCRHWTEWWTLILSIRRSLIQTIQMTRINSKRRTWRNSLPKRSEKPWSTVRIYLFGFNLRFVRIHLQGSIRFSGKSLHFNFSMIVLRYETIVVMIELLIAI